MSITQINRFIATSLLVLAAISSTAAEVNKIIVQGNKRIPSSSIIAYSQLAPGTEIQKADITEAIKSVYSKALFDQVALHLKTELFLSR